MAERSELHTRNKHNGQYDFSLLTENYPPLRKFVLLNPLGIQTIDFFNPHAVKALNKAFAPEFLNRVDDIIMFDQLDKAAIHKIIDIELQGLYQRVSNLGYELSITDEAKDFIATKGYDIQFGARPLKRAIQKYLEDEMAEMIIRASVGEGDTIIVDFDKEEQKITTSIKKKDAE